VGKLFAVLVAIITVVSTWLFVTRHWWFPVDVSVLGAGVDHQMMETMVASGILFVLSQLVLAAFVWQSSDTNAARPIKTFPGGVTPMVVLATLLVSGEVAVLSLVGSKIWAGIYLTPAPANAVQIDVQAEQFAYYFRYAGADGKFGGVHPELIDDGSNNFFGLDPANDTAARDDIVSATLTVPVGRPIALTMHAKDVGHALFIPDMRLQQDFVPGLLIPLHFTATQVGKHEIVCTQLCGLGHYNMKAYVDVVTPEQFEQWLRAQAAAQ
jgi:cytochrome c oxidase subunit II